MKKLTGYTYVTGVGADFSISEAISVWDTEAEAGSMAEEYDDLTNGITIYRVDFTPVKSVKRTITAVEVYE